MLPYAAQPCVRLCPPAFVTCKKSHTDWSMHCLHNPFGWSSRQDAAWSCGLVCWATVYVASNVVTSRCNKHGCWKTLTYCMWSPKLLSKSALCSSVKHTNLPVTITRQHKRYLLWPCTQNREQLHSFLKIPMAAPITWLNQLLGCFPSQTHNVSSTVQAVHACLLGMFATKPACRVTSIQAHFVLFTATHCTMVPARVPGAQLWRSGYGCTRCACYTTHGSNNWLVTAWFHHSFTTCEWSAIR